MRKGLLLLVILLFAGSASGASYIEFLGNGYFSGNVGIGVANPQAKLHVDGMVTIGPRLFLQRDGSNFSWIGAQGNAHDGAKIAFGFESNDIGRIQQVRLRTNNENRLIIDSEGRVGIGTTSPDRLLDINGSTRIRGTLNMSDNRITNLATPTQNHHAATKAYVDSVAGGSISRVVETCTVSGLGLRECTTPVCPNNYVNSGCSVHLSNRQSGTMFDSSAQPTTDFACRCSSYSTGGVTVTCYNYCISFN